MKVLDISLNQIKPYTNNPRNNDRAVEVVAQSIKEFGFKNPIVLDRDYVIINGHTRYLAAQKLCYTFVPAIIADDLSDEQVKAFRIMDNKSSEFAEWDYERLLAEVLELDNSGYDLDFTGFTELELAEIRENLMDFENIDDIDTTVDEFETTSSGKTMHCPFCDRDFEV